MQQFKTQKDLVEFISQLPRPNGQAKVQGEVFNAHQILDKCINLVPKIFEYRQVLAKGMGGIGNTKGVDRFAEATGSRSLELAISEYQAAMSEIEKEVDGLSEIGMSEELASQLRLAKSKAEAFKMIRSAIIGFKASLQEKMEKVTEAYNRAFKELNKLENHHSFDQLKEEMKKQAANTDALKEHMDLYCDLQISYNSILLATIS